ncbi:hypothetical protein HPB47_023244 [Ixodes persulcatus]|uniref:Uncharacterized protein n=1 Tax=Ixodes persulcatus TaxID=34615 RepID=A0AC60Q9X4_IXOPE|nr:hypothetical protein HPB47_023244 [Ixodes persulcatus]
MRATSQEGVDRLKRKRTTPRAGTTKIINEIGVLLATDPTDIGELEETFYILLLKEASLKELDKEIEPSVEYDALEEEISGAEGLLSFKDVLCFTKTWNAVNVDIAGYATVARTQGFGRPAGGVEFYVKRSDKRSVNALDLQLRPTADQRSNGEHCAASVYGVNVMTKYLAPNLSRTAVEQYIDEAMAGFCRYPPSHKEVVGKRRVVVVGVPK